MVLEADEAAPVFMAWPAGPESDPRHPARLVAARMIERRMRVVREGLGASYGVQAELIARVAGGMYLVRGSVDARRAAEAVQAMKVQAETLRAGDGLAEDFVRARQEVIEQLLSRATASDDLAARLDGLTRQGHSPEYFDELIRIVAGLTVADVRAVLAADLLPEHEAIVLGGPRSFLERAFAAAGLAGARIIDFHRSRMALPPTQSGQGASDVRTFQKTLSI